MWLHVDAAYAGSAFVYLWNSKLKKEQFPRKLYEEIRYSNNTPILPKSIIPTQPRWENDGGSNCRLCYRRSCLGRIARKTTFDLEHPPLQESTYTCV